MVVGTPRGGAHCDPDVAYACGLALKGRGHEDAVRAWIQQPAVLSPAVCRPRNGMEWTLHCVCLGTTCAVLRVGGDTL